MKNIIIDCFGGDNSPSAPVLGALNALKKQGDFMVTLVGDEEKIKTVLNSLSYDKDRVAIIDAKQVVSCEDAPTEAVKNPETSMMKCFSFLKENSADAIVSSGSTGALLVASVLKIGRIKGVSRPALAPFLPTEKGGQVLLIDAGANADCKPINLVHFAVMGSVYVERMLNIKNPKVALLSNGTEDAKGNELTKTVNGVLRNCSLINFIGNVEARSITSGEADVVVCDGFSGNVALKSMEGLVSLAYKELKTQIKSGFRAKIGALLLKKSLYAMKSKLDYNKHGGAVFIGINKIIIKAHGSSNADAFEKCVLQAKRISDELVNEQIAANIANLSLPELGV